MNKLIKLVSAFLCMCNLTLAQQNTQILKTNVTKLDVKEGNVLKKGIWELAANVDIDIYEVDNKFKDQKITFYSDIDSLTFSVKPESIYDFVILLNNKTEFKSRISTKIKKYRKNCKDCEITIDIIPFFYKKDNRICIKGKINNENDMDFIFDTGADGFGIYQKGQNKLKSTKFTGEGQNNGYGGSIPAKISFNNQLNIGNIIWDAADFWFTGEQLKNYDGLIGYKVFEGKILEINFDNNQLIAHSNLPTISNKYTKCRLEKRNGLYLIELKLKVGNKIITEWFNFDTGNTAYLTFHDGFAKQEKLYELLKKTGKGTIKGADGSKSKTQFAELSALVLGDSSLINLPIILEQPSAKENLPFSIMGVELIKRFNVIVDYTNGYAYLKPNSNFSKTFEQKDEINWLLVIGISGIVIGTLSYIFYKKNRRNAKK